MSLAEAAVAAGWGRSGRTRWHDIEVGRRAVVTVASLDAIARALGCSAKTLLNGG
jgi:hypothetical protein